MVENSSYYFAGKKLYGDDFTHAEIEEWFADEAEGYADLCAIQSKIYSYSYHQLNIRHAFRFIRDRHFEETLGIGSAYGDEFKPIVEQLNKIIILEPSSTFSGSHKNESVACEYVKPNPDGDLPFDSNKFNLITSFGVMHHIPNVTHVMAECYRCMKPGGLFLLREPIFSMGDWRRPRKGLTKRERGIPLPIFRKIIHNIGFNVNHESLCVFPVIPKMANKLRFPAYNNKILTDIDAYLSRLFSSNIKVYHRVKLHEKFAPTAVYYILEK